MNVGRLFSLIVLLAGYSVAYAETSITDVGRYDFSLPDNTLNGLSGIAYAGDDQYWVVGDAAASLDLFEIKLNRDTGRIESVEVLKKLPLRGLDGRPFPDGIQKDREDLSLLGDQVLVVNELCGSGPGPCIDRHVLKTGLLIERIGPDASRHLEIFKYVEHNRAIEAIAARPSGSGFWVANERAMPIDGDPATPSAGSPVRLQSLDSDLNGAVQYVYVTDTIVRPIESPAALVRHSGSRVAALLSLPDDSLVVLENSLQGNTDGLPESRIRLYEVDLANATDLSTNEFTGGLRAKTFVPVSKRRLVELLFDGLTSNYEGMTLGPKLSNGDYAVLLIRDNGRGTDQTIHSLRLRMER